MGNFVLKTGESILSGGGLRLAKGTIKRASEKFSNLPMVQASQLRAGDILIVKDFSERGEDTDGDSLRAGQAIFSRMKGGNCASEHVMLVVADGRAHVIEANDHGVNARDFVSSRQHAVYRYSGEAKSIVLRETVGVAKFFCDGHRLASGRNLMTRGKPSTDYASMGKLAASVFRSKFRGASYHRRIRGIAKEYESGRPVPSGKYAMICSEFAATCFEVGAWVSHALSPIGADPRAMTAKALEAMLNRKNFDLVGRFQGDVSHEVHQQMVKSGLTGPLVAIGDREIRAGNTFETLFQNPMHGCETAKLKGHTVSINGSQTQMACLTFADRFNLLALSKSTPKVHYASEEKYDYLYTDAPQFIVERTGVLYIALRAPR